MDLAVPGDGKIMYPDIMRSMSTIGCTQQSLVKSQRQTEDIGLLGTALRVRMVSALLVAIFGTMLGFGLYVNPNAKHPQLGLPPCGFYTVTGVPCPTCGYTTAVSHVAHGQWIAALLAQPAGASLGFLAVAASLLGVMGLVTGRWFGPSAFFLGWNLRRLLIAAILVVLAGWGYKVVVMSQWFRHHG